MADVQIAVIDQQNTEVTVAVPGIQGATGQTGDVAVAQDGTAGTPGIRFENDTDTGIYRPGADQLALSTGGAGKLFINSSGVVEQYSTASNGTGIATALRLNSARAIGGDGSELTWNLDFPGYSALAGIAGVFAGLGNSGYLVFKTVNSGTYAERLRLTSDGYLRLAAGSGGIQFGGDTAAANALDDYEEGTWTPNQGAGLTVVGAFSSSGTYTKAGNIVHVRGTISGATSIACIAGNTLTQNLPFECAEAGGGGNATNADANQTCGLASVSPSRLLYSNSAITASANIFFAFTYRTT